MPLANFKKPIKSGEDYKNGAVFECKNIVFY